MKKVICFILAITPLAALALPHCEKAKDPAAMHACWAKAAKESHQKVLETEANTRKLIKQRYEDHNVQEAMLVRFSRTTRTFRRFRQAKCDYEASLVFQGKGSATIHLMCETLSNETYVSSVIFGRHWYYKPAANNSSKRTR